MDSLKLFTVDEVRNLLVKWWMLYKEIDTDAVTNYKFMYLVYYRTFELMSLATINGEKDNTFFVEAVINGTAEDMLDNVKKMIKQKYPLQEYFIRATESMLIRLYSLPLDSEPLFGGTGRK